MSFHPAKCEVIRFSRRRNKSPETTYMLHDQPLSTVNTIKYLGVKIQNDLRWNCHVDYITSKAATTLSFIRRTIPSQSKSLRARAYKQLVRPVLEYASCSFDPLPKTLEDKVEACQRRAARAVYNVPRVSKLSTTGLLKKLNWPTLKSRRHARKLALFRALHFKEVDLHLEHRVRLSTAKTSSRRHRLQYAIGHHNTEAHKNTFFVHTSRQWNLLDRSSRLLCSPG